MPMRKDPLARDVFAVTAIKLAVVIAAALLVFSPARRPRVDARAIEARLIGEPIAGPTPGDTPP
jgi:hypothetical protein